MASILKNMDIPLDGKHHSGIDDARNIAKICIKLVQNGFQFRQAMVNDCVARNTNTKPEEESKNENYKGQ